MFVQLFSNLTASFPPSLTSFVEWPGGDGAIIVSGAFSGSSLSVAWEDVLGLGLSGAIPSSPISATGIYNFTLPKGKLQMSLGGGSVSGLNVAVASIEK